MAAYLEFEDKIKKIEDEIITAKTKSDEHAVEILEKKLEIVVKTKFLRVKLLFFQAIKGSKTAQKHDFCEVFENLLKRCL